MRKEIYPLTDGQAFNWRPVMPSRLPRKLRPAGIDLVALSAWIISLTIGLDVFYELKLYDLIGAACILRFRKTIFLALRKRDDRARWLVWFLGFIALGSIVTIVQSQTLLQALVVLLRLYRAVCFVSIFLILSTIFESSSKIYSAYRVIFLAALFQAVIITLQWLGVVPILWPAVERYYFKTVPTGTLGLNHLNPVLFMVVGITAGIVLLVRKGGSRSKLRLLFFGAGFVLMILAIFVGQALSGLVAVTVMGASMLRKTRGILLVVVVLAIVAGLQLTVGVGLFGEADQIWNDRITSRGVSLSSNSEFFYRIDRTRTRLWLDTISVVSDRPEILLVGVGFQNFKAIDVSATGAHNQYLTILVELGVGGLAVYLLWLWALWRSFRREPRYGGKPLALALWSARVCLLTLLVLGLFNSVLYPVRAMQGFFGFAMAFFGVVVAMQRQVIREKTLVGGRSVFDRALIRRKAGIERRVFIRNRR